MPVRWSIFRNATGEPISILQVGIAVTQKMTSALFLGLLGALPNSGLAAWRADRKGLFATGTEIIHRLRLEGEKRVRQ